MFENLSIFRAAHAMAAHAGARQNILAQNMANADTPDYAARDITPFAELARDPGSSANLRTTRTSHLGASTAPHQADIFERLGERDPNGNSVSLETEMLNAVETKRQHDRALAIYKSSLTVLRSALGK